MDKYIGTKLIQAEPMTAFDFSEKEGKFVPGGDGYKVVYEGGYVSWSPKEVFEKAYLKVDDNKELPSGVSIGPKMVKDFIKSYEVIERDGKTTIVHATLINGYKLTEASSCVDPKNYSRDIGVQICLDKIDDKIRGLLGFLLQTAVNGIK